MSKHLSLCLFMTVLLIHPVPFGAQPQERDEETVSAQCWVDKDEKGNRFKKVFTFDNKDSGAGDGVTAWKEGNFALGVPRARIIRIDWSCFDSGTNRCGWSYGTFRAPSPDLKYAANYVLISADAFRWFREWHASPLIDIYTVYYEIPKGCECRCMSL